MTMRSRVKGAQHSIDEKVAKVEIFFSSAHHNIILFLNFTIKFVSR